MSRKIKKKWLQDKIPFTEEEKWETEKGVKIEVGNIVKAEPTYIDKRLKAEIKKIHWDPIGFGDPEEPMECRLRVFLKFTGEEEDYNHMAGKHETVYGYDIDYVIGGISQFNEETDKKIKTGE